MLEVAALDAGYGRAQVLFGVALAVEPGEVVALLGRNGAGKSTTLKALIGLVRRSAGEVRFLGRRIDGLEPHEAARLGLGYVPEERRIFTGLTVAQNLEVGRRPGAWDRERVLGLFPALRAMLERPAGRMSGGEQQMLAIARTLMGNPRLLLLDEPSEGLAPVIVEQVARAVLELKAAGIGVLLAEQNRAFTRRVADRSCTLEKGRMRDGE
jgi:branched-chain amino acid transport system ATP-binding protein